MSLTLLASNNASTVLASSINASATTLTVNTGAGSLFPSPVSGTSFFKLTLIDAATGQLTEIVHVTARVGDVMTIERAQEGTAARVWSANDIAANMMTAGTLSYILGNFQPLDATLTALAGLTGAADKLPYFNGPDTAAVTALTAFAREILAQTDAAGVLSKLGVSPHGQLLNVQTFLTSGTYIKTPGTNFVIVKQIGGGGASGAISATSSNQNSITCPGANGVYAEAKFTSGFNGVSVTVGAGGQPRLGNGFDGGQTSFGSLLVCPGGTGSLVGNPTTAPGYTSPQNGTSAPTVDPSGTLLASDYGSYLQPALIAGLGIATNYASWKLTPFDRKGMGGNGRLNGLNGVQQQGVAGNDGFCQVWEYS